MNTTLRLSLTSIAFAGACVASTPAMAVAASACGGISVGTSTVADVTLGGLFSDGCVISLVNPESGPLGDSSGFSGVSPFGSGWSLLSKVTGSSVPSASSTATLGGVDYNISFAETNTKSGTWTISANKAVTVDLAFAVHASNRSGAFLFDDQVLAKNVVTNGSWAIKWLNNGGSVPDFSNLTIFARNQVVNQVPEPETYAMMLAGLAMVGVMARRRRNR